MERKFPVRIRMLSGLRYFTNDQGRYSWDSMIRERVKERESERLIVGKRES